MNRSEATPIVGTRSRHVMEPRHPELMVVLRAAALAERRMRAAQ